MQFLAGILVAWSAVYLVITTFVLVAFFRFGRNRDYFAFATVCLLMGVYTGASAVHHLAVDPADIIVPDRIQLAVLPLASASLLYLSLNRSGIDRRRRIGLYFVTQVVALLLAGIPMAGYAFDYGDFRVTRPAFIESGVLYEFGLTFWGYISIVFSLVSATAAGVLLARNAAEDAVARRFYYLGIVLLNLVALNDVLLASNIIRSVYLVEHGFFFITLSVLVGFLREFEISRSELRATTLDLRQASQRLDRAADETRRLRPMADLGKLSASLAHEIRNPLAVLSNVTSTLRRRGARARGSEQFDSLVTMLREETDRLDRLVEDLLLFSQSGSASRQPVTVNLLVSGAVSEARRQLPADDKTEIVIDVPADIDPVPGSAENLKRALSNLITNAVQSSGGGGGVRVIARRDETTTPTVNIGVRDNAGGVAQESLTEIFEPFFTTRSTGTGLGLPIARSIVEAHNGVLELENRPGDGATFWMRLPIAQ